MKLVHLILLIPFSNLLHTIFQHTFYLSYQGSSLPCPIKLYSLSFLDTTTYTIISYRSLQSEQFLMLMLCTTIWNKKPSINCFPRTILLSLELFFPLYILLKISLEIIQVKFPLQILNPFPHMFEIGYFIYFLRWLASF